MTNLLIREPRTTEPFRLMRDLLRWDPFREGGFVPVEGSNAFLPSFEIKETPSSYVFKADMPGIRNEDLEINLTGNRLTISGRREAEGRVDGETYHLFERSFGSFTRSFNLPEEVDPGRVDAELKEGVLTLSVPKKPEAQPQKIVIKS